MKMGQNLVWRSIVRIAPVVEEVVRFWCNRSLYGKLTPDIDTHPQLLLPLVGKYAR